MVTTPSAQFADKLRTLRSHGWARHLKNPPAGDPRYTFVDWGFNVRPLEVSAAIGLVQLERLPHMDRARRHNYETIADSIKWHPNIDLPSPVDGVNWFGFPLFSNERDSLATFLESNGVETRPILAGNLARQPAIKKHKVSFGELPGADKVHDEGLYIGLHPEYNSEAERVGDLLQRWRP